MQHRRRVDRQSPRIGGHDLAEPIEECAGNQKPNPHPIGVADVGQRQLDLPAQVPGDAIRCFGGP